VRTEPILTRRVANEKAGEIPSSSAPPKARSFGGRTQTGNNPVRRTAGLYARLLGEETGRDELIIGNAASIPTMHCYAVQSDTSLTQCRCGARWGQTRKESVGAVVANAQSALKRRRFPFPLLVERMRVPRNSGATPLFQSMLAFYSWHESIEVFSPSPSAQVGHAGNLETEIMAETVAMPASTPSSRRPGSWRDGNAFSGRLQL